MKSVRPSTLVKSQTPDYDEVQIWHTFNSMSKASQSEVIDRLKSCDDVFVRERATKLLRAAYVV